MKRNTNANAGLIYVFTAVYCVKTNTADTKAKHTITLTTKQSLKMFLHFGVPIE